MKFLRHLKILELVEKYVIETQEELSDKLRENGFDVTQATVSRDIKELRLVKILTQDGRYRYAASAKEADTNLSAKFRVIFKESVQSVDYANNIMCIRTLPGMGAAAASGIDAMQWSDFVGSIAGDDTVFVLLKSEEAAIRLTAEFNKMLKQ
ncbi:MAG: arginine repressor [Eubacteriales bacterium]|jgi:transcriptional regulator of arginine metabolism